MKSRRICVFCGSNPGTLEEYGTASDLAIDTLAKDGWGFVYGGATCGLMGRIADRALALGAEVQGVVPKFFAGPELLHQGLTELHLVETMHERKIKMIELSDAFLVLPGGFGTLDELFEVLTLAQLGGHAKPTALLNVQGFYEPLKSWIDQALDGGFIKPDHKELFFMESDPEKLASRFASHAMPEMPQYIRTQDL